MSAGQGLGAIGGAVIGFFTGGPAGALKGAYWGYMAGSIIDPPPGPHTEGPRLNDRVVQTSEEGAPLPTIFGTVRIAGNVIWSSGLEEIATTTEQGGGGSGGGGATSTTYSYKTDAAITLCAGEITGVRRIWADAKLIYDVGETVNISTLLSSNAKAAGIRVYTGSETQAADPLIQAIEGAVNTPAFRGMAYVVFEDLQLADFGNRLPNFSFEVVKGGSTSGLVTESNYTLPLNICSMKSRLGYPSKIVSNSGAYVAGAYKANTINFYYLLDDGSLILRKSITFYQLTYALWNAGTTTHNMDYDDDSIVLSNGNGNSFLLTLRSDLSFKLYRLGDWSVDGYYNVYIDNTYISTGVANNGFHTDSRFHIYKRSSLAEATLSVYLDGYAVVVSGNHLPYIIIKSSTSDVYRGCIYISDNYIYLLGTIASDALITTVLKSSILNTGGTFNLSDILYNSTLCANCNNSTIEGGHDYNSILLRVGNSVLKTNDNIIFDSIGTVPSLASYTSTFMSEVAANSVYVSGSYNSVAISSKNKLTKGTQTLRQVASEILEYAQASTGLPVLSADQYDTTSLSDDIVRGYVVGRPMSGRAALEPLQTAYHFDLSERDGRIYAIKRGGSVVATIPEDDLGAAETPDGVKMHLTRHNDTELPSEIHISYSDIDNDHQAGTQYARSLTAQTTNIQQISLPLGMTSQEAAQLAEVILNSARYTGRHTLEFSLSYEYARLAPADVVSLPGYGVQWSARIGQVDLGMPGLARCQASPEIAALYASILAGGDASGIGQTLGLTGITTLNLLDCALLRDDDNSLGWYVALTGSVDTWPGGALYKSNDGGATWTYAASAARLQSARSGTVSTALAAADCRVWDKTNTISVRLQADATLASTTEANLLAGANSALLGASGRWELIQFMTATLETDGSYTLRDLLRGRKGTEHAAASHAAGDTFILLETSTLQNLPAPSAELNAARDYKALTLGQALEAVSSTSHTYTGERLRCLAPVELGGGRDASGNLTLTWKRRDRINSGWNDYADIPMSETSEAYEVDIYTSGTYGTLKRTLTGLTTPTASYTSAQQVTDFGANQATVYARVYQLSATTGRGHYLQGVI